jgi:hypothetical protein
MSQKGLIFKKAWFYFFIVKLLYMFLALFVYSKFTELGDTSAYLSGRYYDVSRMFTESNYLIGTFGKISSSILGTTFGNLPFVIVSFYGIYYPVKRINLTNKQLYILLTLLSLPSFGIWTSICSKESLSVFFMGIFLGYIIEMINNQSPKLKLIHFIALYLMLLIKPQYSVAIFSLIVLIKIYSITALDAYKKIFIFLLYLLVSITALYIFRDLIDQLSFMMPKHFGYAGTGATRENIYIVEQYDIFFNAPYNMFLAFWGPTISEVIQKPINGLVFIETMIIFGFFVYLILKLLIRIFLTRKLNILHLTVVVTSTFWILFAHMPFGLFNYGSAVRYRESFYSFLVILLFYIFIKSSNKKMIKGGV